jgi:outer membrane protein assembly factor BamB
MQRSFTLTLLLLLLTACLLCSTVARAEETLTSTPAVMITPIVGPPTTNVLVSGTGFDPNVAVDIYFDKTDLALATTNGAGAFGRASVFGGIALQVPASALPGTHWITARERSGKAAQKSFLVRTDWAQFHFSPDHKGLNPYENVLSQTTVGSMDLRWSYPAGTRTYYSSPTVANGVVYVGSMDENLYALNASTGALLWTYPAVSAVSSSPAVANGVVYFGSEDENLYALNASTGALLWKYTTGSAIESSPAVVDGVVYVGSEDGKLYAFNASTGVPVWVYPTGVLVYSSPAVANGVVYFGSCGDYNQGTLFALNARTGAVLWTYTGEGCIIDNAPAVANGVVYVGSVDDNLYALNATTGALQWTYATNYWDLSSPTVANGVVYVDSDALYALNASTGALLWSFTGGNAAGYSVAVANGVVYAGLFQLYALNASTGALLWEYSTGDFVSSPSPAVANGIVYVGSFDGNVYAFGLPSGQSSESFSPPGRPDPSLLVPDWTLKPSTPVSGMPSN